MVWLSRGGVRKGANARASQSTSLEDATPSPVSNTAWEFLRVAPHVLLRSPRGPFWRGRPRRVFPSSAVRPLGFARVHRASDRDRLPDTPISNIERAAHRVACAVGGGSPFSGAERPFFGGGGRDVDRWTPCLYCMSLVWVASPFEWPCCRRCP